MTRFNTGFRIPEIPQLRIARFAALSKWIPRCADRDADSIQYRVANQIADTTEGN